MGGRGRGCVFTELVWQPAAGASGGHISVLTEIWKRTTKGAAAPVGSPGVMLTGFDVSVPDGFALVPRPNFNQGWRSAYPHPFVPTAVPQKIGVLPQPPDCQGRKALVILSVLRIRRSRCSTQRRGDKRSAPQGYLLRGTEADLIASIAPMRTRWTYVRLPSVPPYQSRFPKGGFGALWLLFPLFLAIQKGGPRRDRKLDEEPGR